MPLTLTHWRRQKKQKQGIVLQQFVKDAIVIKMYEMMKGEIFLKSSQKHVASS